MKRNFTTRVLAAGLVTMLASVNAQAQVPAGYTGKPFKQHVIKAEGTTTIEGEDFDTVEAGDEAAENITYFSSQCTGQEAGSWPGSNKDYRPDARVAIANSGNYSNGVQRVNIGNTSKDDFLCYTIEVEADGDYRAVTWVSTGGSGGFQLYVDGEKAGAAVGFSKFDADNAWNTYGAVVATGISLTKGTHLLKWVQTAGMNLDKFVFNRTGDIGTTPLYPMEIGKGPESKIEAEWFDADPDSYAHKQGVVNSAQTWRVESGVACNPRNEASNGVIIGNTTAPNDEWDGDFFTYTFTNYAEDEDGEPTAFMVYCNASTGAGGTGRFQIIIDDDEGQVIEFIGDETDGWNGYEDRLAGVFYMTQGEHKMVFKVLGGLNFDYFLFSNQTLEEEEPEEFDDTPTTGIQTVNRQVEAADKAIFNLQGQRLSQPARGLNIINGKKVVVK